MKRGKQIVFILIAVVMILLSIGLIIWNKNKTENGNRMESNQSETDTHVYSEPVKALVLEAGACSVEVIEGTSDSYVLSYENLKYGTLSENLKDGELVISYKQKDDWGVKLVSSLSANEIREQKITLAIPKGAVLESALLEFGAAEVEIEALAAEKLYITVGAGELNARKLTATELTKLTVGAGAFYADDVSLANAELDCGVGEMELAGTVYGESTVNCGVGELEINIDGAQEAYYGELSCGLGELQCGTIMIEGSGNKSFGTSSAENRMDIKCGIGEVTVQFKK